MAEDGVVETQGVTPHPLSRRGPPPGDFISHERKAEQSKPTVFTRASLSGRARRACPVHLPYRSRDSNPHSCGLGAVTPTDWSRAA